MWPQRYLNWMLARPISSWNTTEAEMKTVLHTPLNTRPGIQPAAGCSFWWEVQHRRGLRILDVWVEWNEKTEFKICVCACVRVFCVDIVLEYSRTPLLQPVKGTDQMDDQTLIIPLRLIPSKAVINFAELHQIWDILYVAHGLQTVIRRGLLR